MTHKKLRWIRTTRGATPHKVCFGCRVSFKDITVCPHCHRALIVTRVKFKPPRRSNLRDWKRLYLLYLAGQSWNAASTPRDAKQMLEEKWTSNSIDRFGANLRPARTPASYKKTKK